ncbi:MAG: carboxypeptidase regulatory-like domain-containing protein [Planctomycetota bacterium]|nr:carboxypeptidase regulatory-like domain-containing protein [Planctomycetaceae bacterium]MDQ3331680.1 carboxypeptidase regulatory-like domain-containing protein [Planctomycetota bacterium]
MTGTVTMDGKPLPQALVRFLPQDGVVNRPSTGVTEIDGTYRLLYSAREEGAVVGPAKIEISTGDPEQPMYPETVPAKYNAETTLSREVEAGSNVFDFELESK